MEILLEKWKLKISVKLKSKTEKTLKILMTGNNEYQTLQKQMYLNKRDNFQNRTERKMALKTFDL